MLGLAALVLRLVVLFSSCTSSSTFYSGARPGGPWRCGGRAGSRVVRLRAAGRPWRCGGRAPVWCAFARCAYYL